MGSILKNFILAITVCVLSLNGPLHGMFKKGTKLFKILIDPRSVSKKKLDTLENKCSTNSCSQSIDQIKNKKSY